MTSIEWFREKLHNDYGLAFSDNLFKQAKEMHKAEQESLYTEEQVREALFYALNVNRTTCCTTITTDSIVREAIKSIKQPKKD
jgi:hypothetical protein